MHPRRKAYWRGIMAEWYCAVWLLCKGYTVHSLRYKHAQGEIDVVAACRGVLVCVEVKARASREAALSSITRQKRYRTQQAAMAFCKSHRRFLHHDLRFDVMVVTSTGRIHHLKNAWSIE